METVGEQLRAVGAENDDRRELGAVGQRLGVVDDDVVVNGRADLSSGIGDETVQRKGPHAQGHAARNRAAGEEMNPVAVQLKTWQEQD